MQSNPKISLKNPKILLLDIHNTIIPSMKLLAPVFAETLLALKKITSQSLKEKLMDLFLSTAGTSLEIQTQKALELIGNKKYSKSEAIKVSELVWSEFLKASFIPFKEIPKELKNLKNAGWKIFISTDNPQGIAEHLIQILNLSDLVDGIYGKPLNENKHKVFIHTEKISKLFKIHEKDFPNHFVFFGDSLQEMSNAKKLGIIAIARTTSFPESKMRSSGASYIIPVGSSLKGILY